MTSMGFGYRTDLVDNRLNPNSTSLSKSAERSASQRCHAIQKLASGRGLRCSLVEPLAEAFESWTIEEEGLEVFSAKRTEFRCKPSRPLYLADAGHSHLLS